MDEETPTEQEAIAAGLAIVAARWDGDSDFDRGMRLLQQHLGVPRRLANGQTPAHSGPQSATGAEDPCR